MYVGRWEDKNVWCIWFLHHIYPINFRVYYLSIEYINTNVWRSFSLLCHPSSWHYLLTCLPHPSPVWHLLHLVLCPGGLPGSGYLPVGHMSTLFTGHYSLVWMYSLHMYSWHMYFVHLFSEYMYSLSLYIW